MQKHEGRFLTIEPVPAGIRVTLTDEGREELAEQKEQHPEWLDTYHFMELMDDIRGNSEIVIGYGDEFGQLTDAPIIARGYYWDGNDIIARAHPDAEIFGFMDYQVSDLAEELLKGPVIFQGGE